MKRAARIALAAVAAVAVVTAMACFPDVTFLSATGGGAAGAAPASSSGSTTTGSGGHTSTSSSSSSSTSSFGGADGGMPCTGTDPCDCDGDGDRADTAECDHDGGDCNDHDPLVSSKQTMWFTTPGSHGWDYNCDGVNEYEYEDVLACSIVGCSAPGWTSTQPVPDCGLTSQYGICSGFPCKELLQGSRPQGCH